MSRDATGAQIAYAHAVRLWPTSRKPIFFLTQTVEKHWKAKMAAHPDIYRAAQVAGRGSAFGDLPPRPVRRVDPLTEIERTNEINRRNMERMMQPVVPPSPYAPHPGAPGPPAPGQPPR